MKRLITTVFATLILACAYAQTNEPGNNIGRTLSQMKQLFPELRYTKTDSKGTQYEDGYPQDGIATFFYFKDNKVIEECRNAIVEYKFFFAFIKQFATFFVRWHSPSVLTDDCCNIIFLL